MVRFGAIALVVLLATNAAAQDKPKPSVTFNLTETTFGPKQNVPMTGTVTPATAPEDVTINVQRWSFADDVWKPFDKNTVQSTVLDADTTEYFFKHPPLPKGRYRARAEVQETDDHLGGKNPWRRYTVTKRHR
jgi:hypothetical protein